MKKFLILISAVVAVFVFHAGFAAAQDDLFDTKAATSLFDKGMEHLRGKKLDQAATAFEESLTIAPEARTYYFLGYTYYLKGKAGDAESRKLSIENFDKAYELDPAFTPNKTVPIAPAAPAEKAEPKGASPVPGAEKPAIEVSQPKDAVAKQQP